jgi:hypothetical protein
MWPTGSITATSRWNGRELVNDGAQEGTGPAIPVRESFSVSNDGGVLTVRIATGEGAGKAESTFVYTRLKSVGSCKTWPTPCKV